MTIQLMRIVPLTSVVQSTQTRVAQMQMTTAVWTRAATEQQVPCRGVWRRAATEQQVPCYADWR